MSHEVDGASFWDGLYGSGGDGWELGAPAPPLARLLREAPPTGSRVAVPGCGRAHDVALFTTHGFEATGFDFSDRAVAAAVKLGRRVLKRDIFALGAEFPAAFDVAWEYTCFCAIDPARRADYVEVLSRIVKPGGELIALLYPLGKEGLPCVAPPPGAKQGPPFPVKRDEVERLLATHFRIESAEIPVDSIERRQGHELLVRARRTG